MIKIVIAYFYKRNIDDASQDTLSKPWLIKTSKYRQVNKVNFRPACSVKTYMRHLPKN